MRILLVIILQTLLNLAFAAPNPSIKFIKNEGQWDSNILFKADISGGYLLVKQNGLQYVFYDSKAISELHLGNKDNPQARTSPEIKGHSFEMSFQAYNSTAKIELPQPLTETNNYFIGNDPTKWRTGVRMYNEVIIKNIYEGIDFRLYSLDQNLKYEYIVQPFADASKINLK